MNKSAYKQNQERRPDNSLRCDKCFVSSGEYGEKPLGTLMVRELISVINDGPNTPIGSLIRCGNAACDKTPVVKLWKAASDLDISPANVYRLVRERRGTPSFRLHELYNGVLDTQELPASVAAAVRPVFGEPVPPPAPTLFEEAPL